MQTDIQKVLRKLNVDTPDWYGWAKHDADGNKIPNDQRMQWKHVIVVRDDATMPTQEEFDAALAEVQLEELRVERNRRIAETDWWASSDLTMSPEQIAYRQALRDITETYASLEDVVWPQKPE